MVKKIKKKWVDNTNQKKRISNKKKNKNDQADRAFNIKQTLFNKLFKVLLFNWFFNSAVG